MVLLFSIKNEALLEVNAVCSFRFKVNLKSCCTVPPDLQAFAKEKSIKLHTHSDPVDPLGEEFSKRYVWVKFNATRLSLWIDSVLGW